MNLRGAGMTSQRARDRLLQSLREKGISNQRVLEAIATVPRHEFVSPALARRAYEDTALPIEAGQTISQPYIVARMSELVLDAPRHARVLEIGTGCGYQCAILAQLVDRVYSVERIGALFKRAHRRLRSELRYHNVRLRHSDGAWGWPDAAPFDVILATAAPEQVPEALLEQLADGGRLIIPVGKTRAVQELTVIDRQGDELNRRSVEQVQFVPFLDGRVE